MIINGVQFNCELSDILQCLKAELALNGIERFYKMFDSGDDIMVCCPYHKNGQERRPSAGIRKSDGLLHCLACDKTVSLDEMIANCFGYNDPAWGYRWLVKNFALVQAEERKPISFNCDRMQQTVQNAPRFVSDEELDSYRYIHPYMYQRGLTEQIIEMFDIGYDKVTDSITFPVRYWGSLNNGKCLFVAKRNVKYKRFDLPKDLEKPLYGLFEIYNLITSNYFDNKTKGIVGFEEIYVCEGLFDCLRLWCCGKVAVAGFGCLFSDYQMTLLEGLPTRKLILATDSDSAGMSARKKIRARIKNKLITEVVLPNGKKDIGELTDEEIDNLEEVW